MLLAHPPRANNGMGIAIVIPVLRSRRRRMVDMRVRNMGQQVKIVCLGAVGARVGSVLLWPVGRCPWDLDRRWCSASCFGIRRLSLGLTRGGVNSPRSADPSPSALHFPDIVSRGKAAVVKSPPRSVGEQEHPRKRARLSASSSLIKTRSAAGLLRPFLMGRQDGPPQGERAWSGVIVDKRG